MWMFRGCRQDRPITSKSMSSNWPIYGAKSPMTAELARVVADRPKENPEARDLRGLGWPDSKGSGVTGKGDDNTSTTLPSPTPARTGEGAEPSDDSVEVVRPKRKPRGQRPTGLRGWLASCRQSGSNCLRRAPSYQPDHPGSLRTGLQLPLGSSMGDLIARQVRPKGYNCPSVVHLTN